MKKLLLISCFMMSFATMAIQIDSFSFKRTGGGEIDIVVEQMEVGFMLQVFSCSYKKVSSELLLIEDETMVSDLKAMFNGEATYINMPIEGGLTGTWSSLSYFSQGEEVLLGDPIIEIDGNISTIFQDVEELGRTFCD